MKPAANLVTLSIISTAFFLAMCEKEPGTGYMSVRMVDAPIDFDEVNVEIEQVQVHYNNGGGWINLATNSGVYNLLDLQNGISAALVTGEELPVGNVQQMRIILGDDNTVMVDSIYFPLELSSQDETGLKMNLNTTIGASDSVEVVFDFDAEKSIVIQGDGSFRLKPVLHLESVIFM
jgi:hypothetical protein